MVIMATIKCKEIEEMVGGKGADVGPFKGDLARSEQLLKEALEQRTRQRVYTQQFGGQDNDAIQSWAV